MRTLCYSESWRGPDTRTCNLGAWTSWQVAFPSIRASCHQTLNSLEPETVSFHFTACQSSTQPRMGSRISKGWRGASRAPPCPLNHVAAVDSSLRHPHPSTALLQRDCRDVLGQGAFPIPSPWLLPNLSVSLGQSPAD